MEQIELTQFINFPSPELIRAGQQTDVENPVGPVLNFNRVFQHLLASKTLPDDIRTKLQSYIILHFSEWHRATFIFSEEYIGEGPLYLYDLWIIDGKCYEQQRLGVLVQKQQLDTFSSTNNGYAVIAFLTSILGSTSTRELLQIAESFTYSCDSQIGYCCIVEEKTISSSTDGSERVVYDIVHIL